MKPARPVDPLLAVIRRGYDTEAPAEVRRCCDLYDPKYGCTVREKCEPGKCGHYPVVLKVAAIEGVLSRQKAAGSGAVLRVCPDCCKTPLKDRQRVCMLCGNKRRRSAYRQYRAKKATA